MNEKLTHSLFSIKSIGIATYIGGPIAGGWLIALNFNRLDKKNKRNEILCYSIAFTILLFLAIIIIPDDIISKVPNFLIPAIYTPIFTFYAHKLQGEDIKSHLENDGKKGSGWAVFGISLGSLLATLALIFGMGVFLLPTTEPYEFEGNIYNYGEQSHVIYHNDVTPKILEGCGDYLLSVEYFSTNYQGIIQVHREGDTHHVYLTFPKDYWSDEQFLEFVSFLKKGLQEEVFMSEIALTLTDEDALDVYRKNI
jgi:hypothetical protein